MIKTYKLKKYGWGGKTTDIEVQLPESIRFFTAGENDLGKGGLFKGALHYTAVIKTDDYTDYQEYFENIHLRTQQFGDLTFILLSNIDKDNDLPLTTAEEVEEEFKFGDYVIVTTSLDNGLVSSVSRVRSLKSWFQIEIAYVACYSWLELDEKWFGRESFESMKIMRDVDITNIGDSPRYAQHTFVEVLKTDEAYKMWDNAIKVCLDKFSYNPDNANDDMKPFRKERDEWIEKDTKAREVLASLNINNL